MLLLTTTPVAFVADTVSVLAPPLAIIEGFATIVTVGFPTVVPTVTVTDAVAWLTLPIAVAVYVVVCVGFTTLLPPDAETGITVPSRLLLIATESAFFTVTVSVLAPPLATVAGLAVIATVTRGFTVTVALAVLLPAELTAVSV
jgi:hypothetical protein